MREPAAKNSSCLYGAHYGPGVDLRELDLLTHLILRTAPGGRNYHPQFTDDKTEIEGAEVTCQGYTAVPGQLCS